LKPAGADNISSDHEGLTAEGEKQQKSRLESNHFHVSGAVSNSEAEKEIVRTYCNLWLIF
jgi:hypothetical protein